MSRTYRFYFTTRKGKETSLLVKSHNFTSALEMAQNICLWNGFSLHKIETWHEVYS